MDPPGKDLDRLGNAVNLTLLGYTEVPQIVSWGGKSVNCPGIYTIPDCYHLLGTANLHACEERSIANNHWFRIAIGCQATSVSKWDRQSTLGSADLSLCFDHQPV
jgi:hypothetical protein